MSIVTEDLRFRKQICEFAQKHGVSAAARRYKTNRQFVYRQLKRYDGTPQSLRLKSTRPHSHSNQHRFDELALIQRCMRRYGHDGTAEVYVQLKRRGYTRSYGSMCKQIRKLKLQTHRKEMNTSHHRPHREVRGHYPGDKVQVDIKYIPQTCIGFDSRGIRYYQITAIDEYSRKRVLSVIDEKNINHTSQFVSDLESRMGFKIKTIQTDNGSEFIITNPESDKESLFQKTLREHGIEHRRTQPYSPWQNGKVERSHRLDNIRLYSKAVFKSVHDMHKRIDRYTSRYNNIHTKTLDFKSPNEVVSHYFNH